MNFARATLLLFRQIDFDRGFPALWVRPVAVGLLVMLVLSITGVPLPRPTKSSSERFPCEKCACHCTSAAQCWDKCCCHTDEEKLAWAAHHGVTPPAFLVRRVDDANRSKFGRAKDVKCLTASAGVPRTGACCCHAKTTDPTECHATPPLRIVLWDAVERCQGRVSGWKLLVGDDSWLLDLQRDKTVICLSFDERLECVDESAESWLEAPDGPVPRRV